MQSVSFRQPRTPFPIHNSRKRKPMLAGGPYMKKLLRIAAFLISSAFAGMAPQFARAQYDRDDRGYAGQWQGRLSPDDQKEFNKEYGKWVDSRRKSDRDDIDKHARKMEEIMARYNIPPDTPFDTVATSTGDSRHYDYREFQGRFSADDQKKFDHEYREWQEERREGDRNGIARHEG